MRLEARASGTVIENEFTNTGGIVLGPIFLFRDPQLDLEAATKRYVDMKFTDISADQFTNGVIPEERMPGFVGDLNSDNGSVDLKLKKTGVKPGTYNKIFVNSKGYVVKVGELDQTDIPNTLDFTTIINKPTTVEGYGITDIITTDGGGVVDGRVSLAKPGTQTDEAITLGSLKALPIDNDPIATGDIIRKTNIRDIPGYLRCNGAWLKRDDPAYTPLYNAIGGRYGEKTVQIQVGEQPDPNYVPDKLINDFYNDKPGTFPGGGRPWENQYGFNPNPWPLDDVWTYAGDLNSGGGPGSDIIVTKNRIYTFGCTNGTEIHKTDIYDDGTIGFRSYYGRMPMQTDGFKTIVVKNRVYIIGLKMSNHYLASNLTFWIEIDKNGDLVGSWTRGPDLPKAVFGPTLLATKSKIYIIGGYQYGSSSAGSVGQYGPLVQAMDLDDNGLAVNAYDTGIEIPYGIINGKAIATKNKIYIIGGEAYHTLHRTQVAPMDATGRLVGGFTQLTGAGDIFSIIPPPTDMYHDTSGMLMTTNTVVKHMLSRGKTGISTMYRRKTFCGGIDLSGTISGGQPFFLDDLDWNLSNIPYYFATKTRIYALIEVPQQTYSWFFTSFSGVTNDYSEFYNRKEFKPAPMVPKYAYVPMFRIPDIDDSAYPGSASYIKL